MSMKTKEKSLLKGIKVSEIIKPDTDELSE